MSLRSQAISSLKWSGISMGAVTALQIITLAVLARLLVPSDFGLMGMIMIVVGFAQAFTDMGISNGIIHRENVTVNQLSSLYWLNIIAGITVFMIVWAFIPVIVAFYREPRLNNLLYLTAIVFLITPFGQQFQILMQKDLRFNELAKLEIVSSIASSITAVVLAIAGYGVYSLIWGLIAGTTSKVLILFNIGWRHWKPTIYFSKSDVKGYLSFGLFQMGERAVNFLNSNIDYLLIGSMLGAKSLGYYTLAYNLIIRPSSIINPAVTKVAFPVLSRMQYDNERLKKSYLRMVQFLSTINSPIMAGLAVIAPIVVPVIFGKQWLPSIVLIQILTIVGLLRSIGNPVGSLMLAKGRADLGFKWNLAIMFTQMPGLYFGAKLGDNTGVAIAFAILMGIYSIFSYIFLVRNLIGPCLHEYIQCVWPSLWMSGVMAVLVFFLNMFLEDTPKLSILILQFFFGLFVYIFLVIFTQKNLVKEFKKLILNKQIP